MRLGREAWILAVLLVVFVVCAASIWQLTIEEGRRGQPSSYSTGRNGLGAAFRLIEREGFRAVRLESPFTHVPENAGLLVVATPLAREISPTEKTSLTEWIDGGGALLLLVTAAPMGARDELPIDGIEVRGRESGPADLQPSAPRSPYLRDVARIHVRGYLRLIAPGKIARPQTLVGDAQGAFAVTWKQGAGKVIAATGGIGVDNAALASADNAVFLANVAAVHANSARPIILFDEYHQGYGEEGGGRSLWQAIGAPARGAAWYLLLVFLLVVYNANRQFGAPKRIPVPDSRPSTEYIASMAGLYRRAAAADVAVEVIYRAFARDLANRVDAPPEASARQIARLAEQRLGWKAGALTEMLDRCEAISRGAKSTPAEMVKLARQMHEYHRRSDLA